MNDESGKLLLSKDRFSLEMMPNNLLASPSFKAWLEDEPLDVNRFLYLELL
ncbi:MAG: hypothetical protein GX201_06905 [Clostridiales bacterium]|nr:hypothetical protein [Clostridiales bacterium]